MKIQILIFLLVFICSSISYSQSNNNIELVESIPVETMLDNPDIRNTQEVWLEMINSAKSTIDIEQFYISNQKGEPLDTILSSIITAANRGVKIRLVVDDGMYHTYPEWVDSLEKVKNIRVRVFEVKKLTGGIQHSKFFIVDGKDVFLGSQNFDWRALKHIHELGVRVNSKTISDFYDRIFEHDFNKVINMDKADTLYLRSFNFNERMNGLGQTKLLPSYSPIALAGNYIVTGEGLDDALILGLDSLALDETRILELIARTKSEIDMQFLTYNVSVRNGEYYSVIDSALIKAALRGVKVKLIVSDWNLGKTALSHFKSLIQNPNFEIKYSEIPEYSGGYISFARVEHCKYITTDSACWIGTSNMSKDYFYNSRNVGLVVMNKKFSDRVRGIFYKDWDGPYTHFIKPDGEYTPREHGEK